MSFREKESVSVDCRLRRWLSRSARLQIKRPHSRFGELTVGVPRRVVDTQIRRGPLSSWGVEPEFNVIEAGIRLQR
jgi:hypothetical protein